ncbi:uncharacterized protein LOC131160563 [Malania oleifera]|uniref:uncharacterized protein LOC131160563 n=1 Tax=Malania oleifera TaxID=397392 RepID=UPI0025ADF28C|nr:uncharacterized protein LOC131160563 [Malania oleifera]
MAAEYSKVLGKAITDSTLEGLPEHVGKTITQRDRAKAATRLSIGGGVFTVCLVHNLTGDTVTYVGYHVWDVPDVHPSFKDIENGQTAIFMQGRTKGTAVVYRGKNAQRDECDIMLAWYNVSWDGKAVNKVYTEIHEANHFNNDTVWDAINKQLDVSAENNTSVWNGCVSTASISTGASPTLNAYFTLADA